MTEEQGKYAVMKRDRDQVLFPTWERMKDQASILHKSGFFPKSIRSPEQALAIMMAGRELDLGPMESLRSVYIVDGQTTISSGLMAAMIWQAGHAYNIDESTDTDCQITFTRSNGQTYTHRFTIKDAGQAGLTTKSNWKSYPKAMLFNRCMSAGVRAFMPDVVRKLYTPEEMGAPVTVSESGDVIIDAEAIEVQEQTSGNGDHWTETQDWAAFWAYWKGDRGLTEDDIHKAAKVESLKDYKGSKKQLQAAVDAYIAEQMTDEEDPEDAKTPEQHAQDIFGSRS